MKKRYINELLWHISLFGCIFFFNRNCLPWCQLELVHIICQKSGVYTDKEISIYHSTSFKYVSGLHISHCMGNINTGKEK